jgi:GT2 family glycosyltransferase
MNPPQVSVVMTVLDGGRYLDEAVQSILDQTFSDFEFIILDDGSTDGTWERLADYAVWDTRIRLVRNPENLGVRRSLNQGLALAQGEYIARQDADDRSAPQRLAAQASFLGSHPEVGLVGTLVNVMDGDGAPLAAVFPDALDDAALQSLLLETCPICHGSVMLRRRCLDATGFYDEGMEEAEDYELWLRLAEVTRLANLGERLYHFRYYADSVSSRRHPKVMLYMALALERAVARRHGPQPAGEQHAPVARAYLRAALASYAHAASAEARGRLARALSFQPALLDSEEALEHALAPYTARVPVEAGADFVAGFFASVLPRSRRLARTQSRLVSRLHMREVFAGVAQRDPARVQIHLWPGLRRDPAWLLNRGVLSLLIKSRLRQRPE